MCVCVCVCVCMYCGVGEGSTRVFVPLMSYANISENMILKIILCQTLAFDFIAEQQTLGIYERWATLRWEWCGSGASEFYWCLLIPSLRGFSPTTAVLREQEKNWPCYECNRRFVSSEQLQQHLNSHDEKLDVFSRYSKKGEDFKNLVFKVPGSFLYHL